MKFRTITAVLAAMLLTASMAAVLPVGAEEKASDTLSCAGSVSKIFVTTAVMQLVEEGRVELDAPVTEYLPEFTMADPRYRDITVRMLMDHTSGILGTTEGDFMIFDDRDMQPHDTMLPELSTQRLKADPGDFAAYCNDGFELLELITERVSGESYTDYVERHICQPLHMEQTGTPWNAAFRAPEQVPTFQRGSVRFAPDYCMDLGSGGILTTAPELCTFGTAFFKGDHTLLSEQSKTAMATRSKPAEYEDGYGLGWDTVSYEDYDNAGVQVLSKGGDVLQQHAELLVAPDEAVSVAVLSSGGSSMYNELMAMALMDIALGEQGITVGHPQAETAETLDTVPEDYLQYEGLYLDGGGLSLVTFPEGRYMEITTLAERPETKQYLYTQDDRFVLMEGDVASGKAVQDKNRTLLHFAKRAGTDYLLSDVYYDFGRTGNFRGKAYSMQRMEEKTVSADAQAAWDARSGKKYYLLSGKYSNCEYYEMPSLKIRTYPEFPGYASDLTIVDADHLTSELCMPGGRDLHDIAMYREGDTEFLDLTNHALTYISEDAIEELPQDLTEVALHTKQAVWYRIPERPDGELTLEIPAHAAVYVYDTYDRVTYSSYMLDYGNDVPLPSGGKIVFLGEEGESIKVAQ
ncbi:MAG: beta-lactamase family protein [Oscillospiraceae bacterium]|nr:beta-lactamase family protein [Oscillospiraceae bacterium]